MDGKHVEPFRAALHAVARSIGAADARRLLGSDRHMQPRLGYRDVASATNRLTLIAAVLPAGCVSTHTVFCLRTPLPHKAQHFLCGLFNSLVINYLVRLRVTTHVTTATVEQLPIPTADTLPSAYDEIGALARVLSREWNDDAYARLNAGVAAMYQLTVEDPEVLVKPFVSAPHAWTLAQDPNDVWTEYICSANEEPDVYKNLDQKTKEEYEKSGRDAATQSGRQGGRGR